MTTFKNSEFTKSLIAKAAKSFAEKSNLELSEIVSNYKKSDIYDVFITSGFLAYAEEEAQESDLVVVEEQSNSGYVQYSNSSLDMYASMAEVTIEYSVEQVSIEGDLQWVISGPDEDDSTSHDLLYQRALPCAA